MPLLLWPVVLPFFEIADLTTSRTQAELERSNRLQYTDLEQKLKRQFTGDDDDDRADVGMERQDTVLYGAFKVIQY